MRGKIELLIHFVVTLFKLLRPGGVKAVNNLNIEVKEGELLVLMGPSGCGKSTTLRMIAGLEEVSEGSILVNKQDITTLHPSKRNIGMVFQNYALYPHKTIFKNLAFGLKLRKTPSQEINRQINDISERLLQPYISPK